MRQLIWIPILHTAADLGSAAAEAQRLHGRERWQALQQQLAAAWAEADGRLEAMGLDYTHLRIYQDAQLVGGERGRAAVAELATRGSQNHQLLLRLVDRGAILEQTEDPALLLQEIELLRQGHGAVQPSMAQKLLTERDRYIAGRINSTLSPGETGLLFLGALHDVQPWLERDILVRQMHLPWGRRPAGPAMGGG